jgi:hypothetical protein
VQPCKLSKVISTTICGAKYGNSGESRGKPEDFFSQSHKKGLFPEIWNFFVRKEISNRLLQEKSERSLLIYSLTRARKGG